MEETLKAWAAGVFDGEGSALIEKTGDWNYQIVVCVVNNDGRIVDVFEENWARSAPAIPGSYKATRRILIKASRNGKPGRKSTADHHKIMFNYSDARKLLVDIQPYLVSRREEVDIVLRAISAIESRPSGTLVLQAIEPFYLEFKAMRAKRQSFPRGLDV